MTVYLYYGNDDFALEQAVVTLRQKLVNPAFASLCHKKLDHPQLPEALEAIGSIPMAFGQHTLVELNTPTFLHEAAKTEADEADIESLKALLETCPDDKSVLMVARKFDGKIKINRWLTKQPGIVSQKFEALQFWQTDQAEAFLLEAARHLDVNITAPAAHALVTQLGVDKRTLYNEALKLALLRDTFPTITPKVIEALGYHSDNLFAMVNHWLPGPNTSQPAWAKQQAQLLDDLNTMLMARPYVPMILAPIQTYVNNIFTSCRLAQAGLSPDQIAQRTKQKPFAVKKHLQQFGRVSPQRWLHVKHTLTDVEWLLKSGKLDGHTALEVLFTS
ncbi:MAG: DNA polymerase III subunit delta [Cyanobacteria bacterium HKST-UBA04]|nr:DNA polymerase III subunit delta [Cyanobacteria bacterium HKST-UBA04]